MDQTIKNILLVFLGWGVSYTVKAQDYVPFVDTNKRWVVDHQHEFHPENPADFVNGFGFYRLYFFEGEIELDGQTYQQVKSTCSLKYTFEDPDPPIWETHRCDTALHAYVREDTNLQKVFMHESSPGPIRYDSCNWIMQERFYTDADAEPFEELLMDFSIIDSLPNDTVHFSDRYKTTLESTYYANFWGVDNDHVVLLMGLRSMYEVGITYNYALYFNANRLLGGYGFEGVGLYPISSCASWDVADYNNSLNCYSRGGVFYRPHSGQPGRCELETASSIAELERKNFQLVNPVHEVLSFVHPITGTLVVYNSQGKLLVHEHVRSLKQKDIATWPSGMYIVQWITPRGHSYSIRAVVE